MAEKADEFREELTHLINRHSLESASNTPDFVLANFLAGSLAAFDEAVNHREWLKSPLGGAVDGERS